MSPPRPITRTNQQKHVMFLNSNKPFVFKNFDSFAKEHFFSIFPFGKASLIFMTSNKFIPYISQNRDPTKSKVTIRTSPNQTYKFTCRLKIFFISMPINNS